jgi:hypothetical protein
LRRRPGSGGNDLALLHTLESSRRGEPRDRDDATPSTFVSKSDPFSFVLRNFNNVALVPVRDPAIARRHLRRSSSGSE